jgi:dTMP kinase
VPGLLIALEGIDGSGTTTQARLLRDWLTRSGREVHLTCEPSQGPIGTILRSILRRELPRSLDPAAVALLFAADRLDHVEHELRPRLAAGIHVVSDRYLASSLAYQSLDLELSWVREINSRAPAPDLTLYLRIDPALARARRGQRGEPEEIFDDHGLQLRISARYDELLGSSPDDGDWLLDPAGSGWIQRDPVGSGARSGRVAILDAALPAEKQHEQLRSLLEKVAPPIGS